MAYYFSDNIHTKSLTPREYQVELLDAAKERNIIVCLCSSSARIFIATKLIQEFATTVRRPFGHGGKRTIYLVDSVAMVAHQATYIRNLTDLAVGEYTESKTLMDWEQELSEKQVLVMTSSVCCDVISNGFLRIKDINLLILDECHHAVKSHPMKEVMSYVVRSHQKPRILGLTAPLFNSSSDPSRLEGEMRRLEATLLSTAETASDIVSVLRYCTKPKEFVIECALHKPGDLDVILEDIVCRAMDFISDHRYDPSEMYDEEFQDELKAIPDPKADPINIFNEFLTVLRNLGPWCADRAALSLLVYVEKLKVKIPYERHFLLLCMVSTVLVRIRAVCDDYFKGLKEREKIMKFSSPKVLRLLEILLQFKPVKSAIKKYDSELVNDGKICTVADMCAILKGWCNVTCPQIIDNSVNCDQYALLPLCDPEISDVKCVLDTICSSKCVCCLPKCNGYKQTFIDIVCGCCNHQCDCVKSRSFPILIYKCSKVRTCDFVCVHCWRKNEFGCVSGEERRIGGLLKSVQHFCKRINHSTFKGTSICETNNLTKYFPGSLLKTDTFLDEMSLLHIPVAEDNPKLSAAVSLLHSKFVLNNHYDCSLSTCTKYFKSNLMSFRNILCECSNSNSVANTTMKAVPVNSEIQKNELVNTYKTMQNRGRSSRMIRKNIRDDLGGKNDVQIRSYRNNMQDDIDALCSIVFVEKKFTAKILYHLLNELRRNDEEFSFLMAQYAVDKEADPVTDPREAENEHRKQEEVLKRFRMRECNLLVSTSVLEEGIDIPKCNLVVRFDVPSVYRSYVQSKGRARAQDAHYILMVEEDRTEIFVRDLAQYYEIEQLLLRKCANEEPSDKEELEADKYNDLVEPYSPPLSPNNSSVTMSTAVTLVNRYCAKLPSDTFTRLSPLWSLRTVDIDGKIHYICTIRLPINSPVKQNIVGLPMPTRVLARRFAALETCRVLHRARELDDNLMPVGKERFHIHEEGENVVDIDELDEMVPRDSLEPRPGTTKRRQYYYKRIAEALTACRPVAGEHSFLYNLDMLLTCPLPEEQNTRGRKIYPPEDSQQGFGILTLKKIPKICPFPIFTRSGEVSVKLELSDTHVILTEEKIDMIVTFLNYTFTSVLRLQKYLMMFDPKTSENSYFIVPTRKKSKTSPAEVDWEFLQRIYENRDPRPRPVPESDRINFVFDASLYHDAVIMPWYRNQDQPQYFYVAEICSHLNPKSAFPGSEYKTFDEYYFKKYGITIQNSNQPLLDVDHTSARLNFLTPRYVNRKGVALPTSSEETKRAKRENLEQKQILVPELCTVHPFPASLWRKAVCLPCILYRINALLLADQIRCQVSNCIALGQEELPEDFEWPPLNFGWSLADVLKKSKENAKAAENKAKSLEREEATSTSEIKDNQTEQKWKSANDLFSEEEKKLSGEWMEIGTWSNDMADRPPTDTADIDEFDPNIALPSNLTLLGADGELSGIMMGGGSSDWGTGIEARHTERVRYGSPSSWLTTTTFANFDGDSIGYESDDSYSDPGNESDVSDSSSFQGHSGIRIEFKGDNIAEAIEDELQCCKVNGRRTVAQFSPSSGIGSEIPWNWDGETDSEDGCSSYCDMEESDDTNDNVDFEDEADRMTKFYMECFDEATKQNINRIETSGILIRKESPLKIVRNLSLPPSQLPNIPVEMHIQKPGTDSVTQEDVVTTNFIAERKTVFHSSKFILGDNYNELETNSQSAIYSCKHREQKKMVVSNYSENEDIITKFSFDAQPTLQGHPGPSPSIILQALTMSNANDGINLERLETIGDSFLKYAITTYLYCTYDNIHEGKLSHLRSKQVSNLNLYRLGRRKVFGESMIATKFEPHDNWLPPCYYVPRELERALVEAGVPASHWNRADLPALRNLTREQICELVRERCIQFQTVQESDTESLTNVEKLPCFIPYNLITQHSIPDKSVADCVEALIGAYLIACGPRGALLFMAWLGIYVLPREEVILRTISPEEFPEERPIGSLKPVLVNVENDGTAVWKQVRYGCLQSPSSPLLRNVLNPEDDLEILLDGYEVFEQKIGYKFRDRSYLLQSLTHASYSPNRLTDCYQRLEFLGDAVLDYLITRHLYEDSRQHSPGALTDLRSALVNNTIFASLAVRYGFHKFFRHLSPGLNEVVDRFVRIQEENGHTISEEYYLIEEEECEEAEDVEVPKALGDVFESVAGAIFLDSDMSLDAVWRVYYRMMKSEIEQFSTNVPKSPIRELLELEPETAKFGKPEKLADGRRVRVTVEVFGKGIYKGIGRNYRIAKCTAAKCALKQLKKKGLVSKKT